MPPPELRPSRPRLILGMHTNGTGEKLRALFGSPNDPHDATGLSDVVLPNAPFNVNVVDAASCEVRSPRCEILRVRQSKFGIRHSHRLWIQLFHSALSAKGRAGFVVANSASNTRSSEQELRRQIIGSCAVDMMVAVGSNLFNSVTLPCTWSFLGMGKPDRDPALPRHAQPPDGTLRECREAAQVLTGAVEKPFVRGLLFLTQFF